MRILIVEDDDIKCELLSSFFKEELADLSLVRAASYQAGFSQLTTETFDLVLLDMTLPVSDLELSPVGMEWLTFFWGGELVLRECKRRKIEARIVVVSQYKTFIRDNEEVSFDQLKAEIAQQHNGLVLGCVHLDRAAENWRQEILKLF